MIYTTNIHSLFKKKLGIFKSTHIRLICTLSRGHFSKATEKKDAMRAGSEKLFYHEIINVPACRSTDCIKSD